MLKRSIDQKLLEWKNQKSKKCLLVRGARQTGKTTSIRMFGETYDSFIEINFLRTPSLADIFSGDLDCATMLLNFSVMLPGARFLPGKTLLFLDEIQECPNAMTSLKFWKEDGRFDVIASGSMLGIDYNRPVSYPVGSIDYYDMKALSFEEFLWSQNMGEDVIESLRHAFDTRTPVNDVINKRILSLLKSYLIVGGMPEAVSSYIRENSFVTCHETKQAILKDYRYDIAHYAPADVKIKAERCYFSLPDQLSKDNHKFKYSVVEAKGTARKFTTSLDWLLGAYLVVLCNNVSVMDYPLRAHKDETNFRMYPSDIGLLAAMFDYDVSAALLTDTLTPAMSGIKGGMYEALIADILYKNGHESLYFRKNSQATFELEFLLEDEAVIPVEVKSENSRSRSLDHALEKKHIPVGYKLINGNVGVSGKKVTLPLYMAMFL